MLIIFHWQNDKIYNDINNHFILFTNQQLSIFKKCAGGWPGDFDSPRNQQQKRGILYDMDCNIALLETSDIFNIIRYLVEIYSQKYKLHD